MPRQAPAPRQDRTARAALSVPPPRRRRLGRPATWRVTINKKDDHLARKRHHGAVTRLLINLDVPDIERAVAFYTRAFELRVGRRFEGGFVELLGAEAPIYLLQKQAGSEPFAGAEPRRSYERHWTPLHLDFVVADLDAALSRALAAGAVLEAGPSQHAYGRLALLHDPFGHGLCLLQFEGKGYDELGQASLTS
jgi:predicted enzyme related to lactoylglutathione lyase